MRHDRRMTWFPLRITTVWVKVLSFAAWIVVGQIVAFAFSSTPPWVSATIGQVFFVFWVVLAARTFRVAGEPVAPPRPWWKASGRPRASFVLAMLCAVVAVASAATVIAEPSPYPNAAFWVVNAVAYFALTVFFLVSGIQQRRNPPASNLRAPLPRARGQKF